MNLKNAFNTVFKPHKVPLSEKEESVLEIVKDLFLREVPLIFKDRISTTLIVSKEKDLQIKLVENRNLIIVRNEDKFVEIDSTQSLHKRINQIILNTEQSKFEIFDSSIEELKMYRFQEVIRK